MTKKHYVAIAGIINARLNYVRMQLNCEHDSEVMERFVGAESELRTVADLMTNYLQTENKLFDRARFLTTCLKGDK